MKVTLFVTLVALVPSMLAQEPQDGVSNPNLADNEVPISATCITARNKNGLCVERRMCDYGSPAIDRTLYAPKGFKRTCKVQEVCCPVDSVMQQTEPSVEETEKEFVFDADD